MHKDYAEHENIIEHSLDKHAKRLQSNFIYVTLVIQTYCSTLIFYSIIQ